MSCIRDCFCQLWRNDRGLVGEVSCFLLMTKILLGYGAGVWLQIEEHVSGPPCWRRWAAERLWGRGMAVRYSTIATFPIHSIWNIHPITFTGVVAGVTDNIVPSSSPAQCFLLDKGPMTV